MLGQALVDLARLLVGVHVEHEPLPVRVATDLGEPVDRARSHGVGGEADHDPGLAQALDLLQVGVDRGLPETGRSAARVRDV